MKYWNLEETTVRTELEEVLASKKDLIAALEEIEVNTKHKTLTNKAIISSAAKIRPCAYATYTQEKELVFYYTKRENAINSFAWNTIRAYVFENVGPENERFVRTLTPKELQEEIERNILQEKENIETIENELAVVSSIVASHNELQNKIKEHNENIRYADSAKIN